MKRFNFLFLALILMAALVMPAFATSIDMVRGAIYAPTKQTVTTLASVEISLWTDSTYLAPYISRSFFVKNKTGGASYINATIEASPDYVTWVTIDATSLNRIAAGIAAQKTLTGYSYPYWRIRGAYCAGTYNMSSPEVHVWMNTQ